jgi:hypothetical protein
MEKKLQTELEIKQFQYPSAEIELWCMDEHRIGLGGRQKATKVAVSK